MVVHGIPRTRTVEPETVQARAREVLGGLDRMLATDGFRILVAESDGERVGYIMLDFRAEEASTGERQCLIHDLAVRRDHWGRFVVHRLIAAAEEEAAARGLPYLVGEVSASNKRALGTALRGLGFDVERHQIVKRIDLAAEGPEPKGT
jgi:ribosomal protein S18 acetylase RimI-like enzyme